MTKIRALGHLVVGFDCYRTSQGCPRCYFKLEQVSGTHRRIKKCPVCGVFFHRDTAAAQLIASLTQGLFEVKSKPDQFVRSAIL